MSNLNNNNVTGTATTQPPSHVVSLISVCLFVTILQFCLGNQSMALTFLTLYLTMTFPPLFKNTKISLCSFAAGIMVGLLTMAFDLYHALNETAVRSGLDYLSVGLMVMLLFCAYKAMLALLKKRREMAQI